MLDYGDVSTGSWRKNGGSLLIARSSFFVVESEITQKAADTQTKR
jgi:hypothetical protein